jgi:hypothetical protein
MITNVDEPTTVDKIAFQIVKTVTELAVVEDV